MRWGWPIRRDCRGKELNPKNHPHATTQRRDVLGSWFALRRRVVAWDMVLGSWFLNSENQNLVWNDFDLRVILHFYVLNN
jgi:hypothetical protein